MNRSELPLVLDPQPSRIFTAFWLLLATSLVAAVFQAGLPLVVKWAITSPALAWMAWSGLQHWQPGSRLRLTWLANGQVCVQPTRGPARQGWCTHGARLPAGCVLTFHPEAGRTMRLVIWKDAVPAACWRRLQIKIRHTAKWNSRNNRGEYR